MISGLMYLLDQQEEAQLSYTPWTQNRAPLFLGDSLTVLSTWGHVVLVHVWAVSVKLLQGLSQIYIGLITGDSVSKSGC